LGSTGSILGRDRTQWGMGAGTIGVVGDLRRYPVKSMLGEQLQQVTVTQRGFEGDRVYALVDEESGKVVSVKRPKRWGRMFELTARTADGTVFVAFPDGTAHSIDDPQLTDRLRDFFGRVVSVAVSPPADAGYDEEWVGELKDGARPYLGMESMQVDGEEFIDGGSFMRANGNFFDFGSLHLVATASTDQLAAMAPGTRFDPHRFRPNIVVEMEQVGFQEQAWQGRTLTIGEARLTVGIPVPRCVMTTLGQSDLPPDREVLRMLTRHNAIDLLGTGTPYPCLGSYADVAVAGRIALGDRVSID
jgi:uncharacterized protein